MRLTKWTQEPLQWSIFLFFIPARKKGRDWVSPYHATIGEPTHPGNAEEKLLLADAYFAGFAGVS